MSRFTARHFPSTARFARVIAVEDPILGKGLAAMVSGLNLNNEVFEFYQGSSQFPISASTTSRRTPFGLRWELGREK
ncbi:MAG: hypothetical protein DMG76_11200 [Acidobacteria bacterium]|nr:MAG: hypothetical protein DMG76_11200 [Acidobacteriota bacterium]